MEDIELTNQKTGGSSITARNESDTAHILQSTKSVHEEEIQTNKPVNNNPLESKKSILQRLKSKIPPLPLIRAIIKASISILISTIFVFDSTCRKWIGSASILVPIGTLLYFPVRPLGVQTEATVYGLLGSLVGSAWCFLGMYLGNLARDPANPSPIQPQTCAILAVFMLVGVFWTTYIRVKIAQALFASIFANIIIAFVLTQSAVIRGFAPILIWTFLRPLALSAAIGFLVDVLIWPDDSVTKYMMVLSQSLKEYNNFFQEHTNAFLSENPSATALTLPSLHARLQNSILKLIDCKREVQKEILFNRLSQNDIKDITRLVKSMRTPLHGIGLGLITKTERLAGVHPPNFSTALASDNEQRKQFTEGLSEMRAVSQELADTCVMALNECNDRLRKFSGRPRSLKSTFLWPFPRIFLSDYRQPVKEEESQIQRLSERLDAVLQKYDQKARRSKFVYVESSDSPRDFELRFNSLLQTMYLFRFNLREHALHLRELVVCVEEIEATRTRRRLWLPHLPLRKYFRSMAVDANMGTTTADEVDAVVPESTGLTLSQTMSRPDALELQEDIQLVRGNSKVYPRDPDVNAPTTALEKFFFYVYKFVGWCRSLDVAFSFKTAGGFVLLSLPAYLPQSAGWFFEWRGQWATITLMIWMFPMTGMFFFTVILRVLGTVIGGVLGIIVWEISRGNPYGLAVVNFVAMFPCYYVFFTNHILNMVAVMVQVTCILVICFEYGYVVGGTPNYDSVEVVAGKRMLLVIIGVAACAILSLFPRPVTGRVELRKRLSKTIRDLSRLYGILATDIILSKDNAGEPTNRQKKAFRKLALGIRRQIADEQTYLKLSKMEPPLRGKFPFEVYQKLVEKVDNMADLVQSMAFASKSVDKAWRNNLVKVIREERLEYLASILSIMKILSSTLVSKMALPPFMLSPEELRKRLAQKLSDTIRQCPEKLDNDTFPSYCAYAVCSYKFSCELEEVQKCIEQLVGVEDPEQWLLLNA